MERKQPNPFGNETMLHTIKATCEEIEIFEHVADAEIEVTVEYETGKPYSRDPADSPEPASIVDIKMVSFTLYDDDTGEPIVNEFPWEDFVVADAQSAVEKWVLENEENLIEEAGQDLQDAEDFALEEYYEAKRQQARDED